MAPPVGQWRLPPAGRSFTIVHRDQRAVISQSGAALRVYDVGPRPVIEPFGGPEAPVVGSQGQVLAPWPNRVVDGRWTWRGAPYQLSLTEPERGHALHGLVATSTWTAVEHRRHEVVLEVLVLAQPGWPFPIHCRVRYILGPEGLTSTLTSTNVGRSPCPYGAAAHPYLAVPGGPVDEAVLHLAADTWLETDERLSPLGRRATAGTPYDFKGAAPVGRRRADTAFTDLAGAGTLRVEATLTAPDGRTTLVWGDHTVRWWQLYTGDTLPRPWHRATLALEPMTCPPDALNSGDDLVILEPGESHSMTWGMGLV